MPSTGKWTWPDTPPPKGQGLALRPGSAVELWIPKDGWSHRGGFRGNHHPYCDMCEARHNQKKHHYMSHPLWDPPPGYPRYLRVGTTCALRMGDAELVKATDAILSSKYARENPEEFRCWLPADEASVMRQAELAERDTEIASVQSRLASVLRLLARPGTHGEKDAAEGGATRIRARLSVLVEERRVLEEARRVAEAEARTERLAREAAERAAAEKAAAERRAAAAAKLAEEARAREAVERARTRHFDGIQYMAQQIVDHPHHFSDKVVDIAMTVRGYRSHPGSPKQQYWIGKAFYSAWAVRGVWSFPPRLSPP
jgi:hypothetical protein